MKNAEDIEEVTMLDAITKSYKNNENLLYRVIEMSKNRLLIPEDRYELLSILQRYWIAYSHNAQTEVQRNIARRSISRLTEEIHLTERANKDNYHDHTENEEVL